MSCFVRRSNMMVRPATAHRRGRFCAKQLNRMNRIGRIGDPVYPVYPVMAIVDEASYRERVYDLVRCIPKGKVMTYGSVAIVLGDGYTPRTVGYVMHSSPD